MQLALLSNCACYRTRLNPGAMSVQSSDAPDLPNASRRHHRMNSAATLQFIAGRAARQIWDRYPLFAAIPNMGKGTADTCKWTQIDREYVLNICVYLRPSAVQLLNLELLPYS
jgi:hypothetical protein